MNRSCPVRALQFRSVKPDWQLSLFKAAVEKIVLIYERNIESCTCLAIEPPWTAANRHDDWGRLSNRDVILGCTHLNSITCRSRVLRYFPQNAVFFLKRRKQVLRFFFFITMRTREMDRKVALKKVIYVQYVRPGNILNNYSHVRYSDTYFKNSTANSTGVKQEFLPRAINLFPLITVKIKPREHKIIMRSGWHQVILGKIIIMLFYILLTMILW